MTTALEIHAHLLDLRAQRALASAMVDVDGEIEATTRAYVGAAVTEITTFRAELFGAQVG